MDYSMELLCANMVALCVEDILKYERSIRTEHGQKVKERFDARIQLARNAKRMHLKKCYRNVMRTLQAGCYRRYWDMLYNKETALDFMMSEEYTYFTDTSPRYLLSKIEGCLK